MLRSTSAATAATLALALCPGVASADTTQKIQGSTGAVQVGSVKPAVNAAAAAPVTANAPVTVASPHSGGDATQTGTTAASTSGGGGPAEGAQHTRGSALSAQVGSVKPAVNAAAAAPVTANAPVTVASPHSGGDARRPGHSRATASGQPRSGGAAHQDATHSTGAGQVQSAGAAGAVAADAPVTANAPVTVASPHSGGQASHRGDSDASSTSPGPSASGEQTVRDSVGTAQIGAVDVSPTTALTAPVTANAPITVASAHSGGDATLTGDTGATATGGDAGTSGGRDGGTSGGRDDGSSRPAAAPPNVPGNTSPSGATHHPRTGARGSRAEARGTHPAAAAGDSDARSGGRPVRGTQGQFAAQPSPGALASVPTDVTREFGALAGGLPFTGLLLWALVSIGVLAVAAGVTSRRALAMR